MNSSQNYRLALHRALNLSNTAFFILPLTLLLAKLPIYTSNFSHKEALSRDTTVRPSVTCRLHGIIRYLSLQWRLRNPHHCWSAPSLPIDNNLCWSLLVYVMQTMTDVAGNPEEERRADFYYQPWAQEAVCRYFYGKVRYGASLL